MSRSEVVAGSNNPAFDLNGDNLVDSSDRLVWVNDLKNTYLGDSNLDGEFSSSDFVHVFSRGKYEDDIPENAGWDDGDWNGDLDFTTNDLVRAFQVGAYEKGPRPAQAVPEPAMCLSLLLAAVALIGKIRK